MAGVDALRASSHLLRLYAAPAPQRWAHADGEQPFAGKQKPAGIGSMPGGSDLSRCSRREIVPVPASAGLKLFSEILGP